MNGLGVADDDALADDAVGPHQVLQHGQGHVLAPRRHDEVLLATGDAQEAAVVEHTDVAGGEPAVVAQHLGGRLRVVPVATEDVAALEQDLAVLGDPDRRPRSGRPTVPMRTLSGVLTVARPSSR